MARIRIVDEWLRSPASEAVRQRTVMVVADGWAEQRVLMRAFASAADQTRPVINLHGRELAISPAGLDPYGPWGIHVQPPVDGWSQELRNQLELAARRLAGSKGNPPRLADEMSRFENKPTAVWAPGSPRDRNTPQPPAQQPLTATQSGARTTQSGGRTARDTSPLFTLTAPPTAVLSKPWESPVPRTSSRGRATPAVQIEVAEPSHKRPASLASLIGKTVPVGFKLTVPERNVLNALGQSQGLSAARVGEIAGVQNGQGWMDTFVSRLSEHGLDLISVASGPDGHPIYTLRR